MQTLTVKNIEEKHTKDGSKSFFIITDTTGASFSLWEPIGMIKPGCVLEADIEVKGKYANIKDFKITSQLDNSPPTSTGNNKPTYGQDSPEKRRSIERQTAATLAFGFAAKEGCTDSVVGYLKIAEQIYQWISQGMIPPTLPSSTPSDAPKQGDNAPAGTGQPEKQDGLAGEKKAYKTDPATIKGLNQFLRACYDDFKLDSTKAVLAELNLHSISEIADFGDAYRTIGAARG